MKKRKSGERGGSLFGEIDLILLRELASTDKQYSVDALRKKLRLAHMSTRRHLNWLVKVGLVSREKVPKMNKAMLQITDEGHKVMNLFENLIKRAKLKIS